MKKLVLMLSLILMMSSFAFAAGNDVDTVLLLHMDGDESASEHVATVNGDPVLDAGEYKFDGSMYFDGSDDYLAVADSTDWNFGSNDFTIDFWVNFDQLTVHDAGLQTLISSGTDYGSNYWALMYGDGTYPTNTGIGFIDKGQGIEDCFQGDQDGWNAETWYHIALVSSGNTLTIYRNGVAVHSCSIGSLTDYNSPIRIGSNPEARREFGGYIDELRISNNARWTSDFSSSLPSSPYTADANTKLLLSLDGDVAEGASNDHDVTFHGNIKMNATEKPSSDFEGSYYFDGSDFLTIPDDPEIELGSDDFTIDFWFKRFGGHGSLDVILAKQDDGHTNDHSYGINFGTGNELSAQISDSSSYNTVTSTTLFGSGDTDWHHVSFIREGSRMLLYIDGILEDNLTASVTSQDTSYPLTIGRYGQTNYYYTNSFISDLRIVKGEAIIPPAGGPTGPYDDSTPCTDVDDDDYCDEAEISGCDNTICPTGWDDCDDNTGDDPTGCASATCTFNSGLRLYNGTGCAKCKYVLRDGLWLDDNLDYTKDVPGSTDDVCTSNAYNVDMTAYGGPSSAVYYMGSASPDEQYADPANEPFNSGGEGNGVPEFSSIGMVLALLIAGLGIVFVIKKRR
ncbi:hypothetical protein GF336_04235 [Candidatus Woesearchaeota archaeon]|nr:hypothetical protein [Candidatus Woesearchaeota archaeon]